MSNRTPAPQEEMVLALQSPVTLHQGQDLNKVISRMLPCLRPVTHSWQRGQELP